MHPSPAAGRPSLRDPPGMPGVKDSLPVWSMHWSLLHTEAAQRRSVSGSSLLQCGEVYSHSAQKGVTETLRFYVFELLDAEISCNQFKICTLAVA